MLGSVISSKNSLRKHNKKQAFTSCAHLAKTSPPKLIPSSKNRCTKNVCQVQNNNKIVWLVWHNWVNFIGKTSSSTRWPVTKSRRTPGLVCIPPRKSRLKVRKPTSYSEDFLWSDNFTKRLINENVKEAPQKQRRTSVVITIKIARKRRWQKTRCETLTEK